MNTSMDRCERILIKYPLFQTAIARIQACFDSHEAAAEPDCCPLVGESGSGKTTIISYFASLHPRVDRKQGVEVLPWHYYQAAHVVSDSVVARYDLPFLPLRPVLNRYPTLVLGENGTAFVTDGIDPDNGPQIVSFNFSSGGANWTYQAPAGNTLTLIAVTAGNGLVAKSTDPGSNDTLLTFSSSGGTQSQAQHNVGRAGRIQIRADQQLGTSKIDYSTQGLYLGFQGGAKVQFKLRTFQEALTAGNRPQGDAAHNGTTDPGLALVATQDCHKQNHDDPPLYVRYPRYSLRQPFGLQPMNCSASTENQCYSMFEWIPEDHLECTMGGLKGVSPCVYRDGSPTKPYNEFNDEITIGLNPTPFLKTQYFAYGLPGQRTWWVRYIYRTLYDGSLQPKYPTASCDNCYEKNILDGEFGVDPRIDGNLDPWLAPWDGAFDSCYTKYSRYWPE